MRILNLTLWRRRDFSHSNNGFMTYEKKKKKPVPLQPYWFWLFCFIFLHFSFSILICLISTVSTFKIKICSVRRTKSKMKCIFVSSIIFLNLWYLHWKYCIEIMNFGVYFLSLHWYYSLHLLLFNVYQLK